jgi:hypothetical protein
MKKFNKMENEGEHLVGFRGEVTRHNKCSTAKGTLMHHFTFDSANNWVDTTAGQLSNFMTTDRNGVRMSGQHEMVQRSQTTHVQWQTRTTQYGWTVNGRCNQGCYYHNWYSQYADKFYRRTRHNQVCNYCSRWGCRPAAWCDYTARTTYRHGYGSNTKTNNYAAGYCNVASWNGENMWVVAGSAANNKYAKAMNKMIAKGKAGANGDEYGYHFLYWHRISAYTLSAPWSHNPHYKKIWEEEHIHWEHQEAAEWKALDDNHYCELESEDKFQYKGHECRLKYDVRVYGHLEEDDKTCIAAETTDGETLTRTCRNGDQKALAHGTDDKTITTNWFKADDKFRIVLSAMTDGTYFNGHEIIGHDDVKLICRACQCPSCKLVKGESDEKVIEVQHHNHESQEPNAVLKAQRNHMWLQQGFNKDTQYANRKELNHRCFKSSDGVGVAGGHKKDLRKDGDDGYKTVTYENGDEDLTTGDNPTVDKNHECQCVCDFKDSGADPNSDLNAENYRSNN